MWEGAAVFYEPSNSLDLAAKIRQLLDDPSLASRVKRGAEQVLRRCRWEVSRETLRETYATLVDRTGGLPHPLGYRG